MEWIHKVNNLPLSNIAVAFNIGLTVPEIKYLQDVNEKEFDRDYSPDDWEIYFDYGFMIKKQNGIPVTINAFWTGEKFIFRTVIFNDPYLFTGGQGMELDGNLITVFENKNKIGKKIFKEIAKQLEKHAPEFKGWISIDVKLADSKLYYRLIRFGILYDFIFPIAFLYAEAPEFFTEFTTEEKPAKHNFACGLRLYAYPFNPEDNFAVVEEYRKKMNAYSDFTLPYKGDSGYHVAHGGKKISQAWRNLYTKIPEDCTRKGICYRIDGADSSKFIYNQLKNRKII